MLPISGLSFGTLQGSLSPPESGRLGCFPRKHWRDELPRAREAGLSYIEWIYDSEGAISNPLTTDAGMEELIALKTHFGLEVPTVYASWFLTNPLIRCTESELARRQRFLHALLRAAGRTGASHLVLPLLGNACPKDEAEKLAALRVLNQALDTVEATGVELHVEASLEPVSFQDFLARIPHPMLRVHWNSGNSAALGYRPLDEFSAYGDHIGSVHLKDTRRPDPVAADPTLPSPDVSARPVPFGEGIVNFGEVFKALRSILYTGGVTLEVARGASGDEVDSIKTQLAFLKHYDTSNFA